MCGFMGRPSIIVSLEVVILNEPLGIGVAVTSAKVEAAADASEVDFAVPEGLSEPLAEEGVEEAAPDEGGLEEIEGRVLVETAVSEALAFEADIDAAAAAVDVVSSRGSTA